MNKNLDTDDEGFTPLQLLKGAVLLLVLLLWPIVLLLGAVYGLLEVYKLADEDEWDKVWQLLIGPSLIGVALWHRYGRSGQLERDGPNWLPNWVEAALKVLLVVSLFILVMAIALDLNRFLA